MSDLAEFYSANLAPEILKGTTQKAQNGGTPHLPRSATSTSAASWTATRSARSR